LPLLARKIPVLRSFAVSANPSATSTTSASLGDQLKLAWSAHAKKDNEQALLLFQAIVEQDATHIDATYGLGLALVTAQQYDRAAQVFTRAAELVAIRANQQSADDEDSRYRMLARMIAQQLEGLKAKQG
jgi:cytochrome c-type biogenesis protein CcmH/NrfG